ncbi:MAG: hypothetical protein M5U19_08390 [Microthrixaceae bacterium]|nr:hypothetical protein [Microthrixaceae bacterium]
MSVVLGAFLKEALELGSQLVPLGMSAMLNGPTFSSAGSAVSTTVSNWWTIAWCSGFSATSESRRSLVAAASAARSFTSTLRPATSSRASSRAGLAAG